MLRLSDSQLKSFPCSVPRRPTPWSALTALKRDSGHRCRGGARPLRLVGGFNGRIGGDHGGGLRLRRDAGAAAVDGAAGAKDVPTAARFHCGFILIFGLYPGQVV